MKAKTTHNAKATLVLLVFATLISVVGANGQTSAFSGKFVLPYQVRWGQAVLPAGAYSINFSSIHSPAIVRSVNGKTSAFVFTSKTGDSEKGPSSLTIVTRGGEREVASLNLPQASVSLVYAPMTKAERETLSAGNQVEKVPLASAKK